MGCRELDISDCFIFSTEKDHFAAHFEYSPFGKIISENGSMPENFAFRFSSEYNDIETGLVYYNYRYYDANMGRWINRDPIGEQGGYNLYGFVGNNAINGWDLLGLLDFRIVTSNGKDIDKTHNVKEISKVNEIHINKKVDEVSHGFLGPGEVTGPNYYYDDGTDKIQTLPPLDPNKPPFLIKACRLNIILTIDAAGPAVGPKGTVYHYWHHQKSPSWIKGGEGHLPLDAVIAHERGHAQAFFQVVIPAMKTVANKYKNKPNLTQKDRDDIQKVWTKITDSKKYIEATIRLSNIKTRDFFNPNKFTRLFPAKSENIGNLKKANPYANSPIFISDAWKVK